MTPFAHTGSNFEKLLKREICRRKSSTHWRKLCINIAYSSGKLNFENFNDVICAYRKYFQKSCCSMINAEFSPLLTGANCAYILSTAALKLNIKNFNDVIRAYKKYFRKSCCSMIYAEFIPLFTGAKCTYILSTAAVKLNFENFNDVIHAYRKYFRKSC